MLFFVGVLLAATPNIATARTEVMSGPCPPGLGGNWTTVLTIDDKGHATRIEGIACGGTHWVGGCEIHITQSDPGEISDYYFPSHDGSRVRCNAGTNGIIGSIWGKDAHGNYCPAPSQLEIFCSHALSIIWGNHHEHLPPSRDRMLDDRMTHHGIDRTRRNADILFSHRLR